ncbi:MAG: acetyl-CoA carboxylase biotin carboxyl carrier protein [Hyphomicrobiales bacterium]|nr:acetyl-CoA carboxylase biotin carboxyl carrier protein [Hyphomicrobiales bacterium]
MAKKTTSRSAPAKAAPAPRIAAKGVDAGLVRELAGLLSETDLSEIEVEKGDLRIRVARELRQVSVMAPSAPPVVVNAAPATPARQAAPAEAAAKPAEHPGALKSPMVGTAYRRPSPEAAPFVDIGSVVKAGDRVLLVEAMKTFNEIVATHGGTVTAILVEDGQPVEYGQPLAIIE